MDKDILILLASVWLDICLGDPPFIPHPIVYIGKTISFIEKAVRRTGIPLRLAGFLLWIATIMVVEMVITGILFVSSYIHSFVYTGVTIYLIYTALAAKCLACETLKVYKALKENDLSKARRQLSYLVGRDTSGLDASQITRAAVETTAENTIDGVLAPLFFLTIGFYIGIPVQLIFLYKTVNTLDSMVGYQQEPYTEIGFASAKIDDAANYLPARMGALMMLAGGYLTGYDIKNGWKVLKRDCRKHKSPNCGFPESAVAGLLGIQIGGTNTYFGEVVYKPSIGDAINNLKPEHIKDAIKIMYVSFGLTTMIIGMMMWLL
ncbi:MAG: adenosylcobinamide-phosphate synthase CbiB [Clostridia bacterium]|nr:adenosylcobinamide-phosphate synthase CbiB [Clostridia bacterium]